MRLATSLALLFATKVLAEGAKQVQYHEGQQLGKHANLGLGDLFEGQVLKPLTEHLDGKTPGLGQTQGNNPDTVALRADPGDCYNGIRGPYVKNQTDFGCNDRKWGCNAENNMNLGDPNLASIQSVSNQVVVTAIPA